jgi:hypothetical protein
LDCVERRCVLGQARGDKADLECDRTERDRPTQQPMPARPNHRPAMLGIRRIRDMDGGHFSRPKRNTKSLG